jgi:hypothetical protein
MVDRQSSVWDVEHVWLRLPGALLLQALLESLRALRERSPEARILDVGGCYAPCRSATHIVDIEPFSALQRTNAYGDGELRVTSETYHQLDICAARFPFPDKSFDFVICRHTLEDLRDPIAVCRKMNRVGHAGYIESAVYESTKGVERPWWAKHQYRWFVEVTGSRIIFNSSRTPPAARAFHFRRYRGNRCATGITTSACRVGADMPSGSSSTTTR